MGTHAGSGWDEGQPCKGAVAYEFSASAKRVFTRRVDHAPPACGENAENWVGTAAVIPMRRGCEAFEFRSGRGGHEDLPQIRLSTYPRTNGARTRKCLANGPRTCGTSFMMHLLQPHR
jgi:hypothetical protein